MARALVVAALGCLATPCPAIPLSALPLGVDYAVRSIRIEGAEDVSRGSVRAVMLTKQPPWYKPWQRWWRETVLDPNVLRSDIARVRDLLRESGHYRAEVSHDLVVDGRRVDVRLTIDEGRPTRVKQIGLVAADFALSAEHEQELRCAMTLERGDVFRQADYAQSAAVVERAFLDDAFAYVRVARSAVVDTATDEAIVTYTITRGPPAVFGTTTISGLRDVAESVVRREVAWRQGDPYHPTGVEKTQAAIFSLDLFRSVAVRPANLDARSGRLDMAIDVVEGPPRHLKVGVGYGLEDELRGQVRWQHANFLGGGRRLGFQLKASAIAQSAAGEFRQPHFLHPRQTLVLPLTQARLEEPGHTVVRTRLAPRIARMLRPDLEAALGYNLEYDDLSDVPRETKRRLEEFIGRGYVSSLTLLVERNTADDLLDPHEGSVVTFTLEQAGGPWGGDFSFVRGLLEGKRYVSIPGRRVLAGRLRIGAGDGFGGNRDLPMFRRFFAGGVDSTRGYDRHKLGPLTSAGDPIGGRSLLGGSVELRTPVWKALGMVVFVDGALVDEQPLRWHPSDLQFAAGPGIRYTTPVGPLRLDVGFPLEPPRGTERWQVHFSIGQAF